MATQDAIHAELAQLTTIFDQIGQLLAKNSQMVWQSPKKAPNTAQHRPHTDPFTEDPTLHDLTGLGNPSDAFFAEIEALKEEYETRFGRILSDAEVLDIHQERHDQLQAAAEDA